MDFNALSDKANNIELALRAFIQASDYFDQPTANQWVVLQSFCTWMARMTLRDYANGGELFAGLVAALENEAYDRNAYDEVAQDYHSMWFFTEELLGGGNPSYWLQTYCSDIELDDWNYGVMQELLAAFFKRDNSVRDDARRIMAYFNDLEELEELFA